MERQIEKEEEKEEMLIMLKVLYEANKISESEYHKIQQRVYKEYR